MSRTSTRKRVWVRLDLQARDTIANPTPAPSPVTH